MQKLTAQLIYPGAAVCIAIGLSGAVQPLDARLVSMLPPGSHPFTQPASAEFAAWLILALSGLAALGGYSSGIRTKRGECLALLLFTVLFAWILQFSLWDSMKIAPNPFGIVLSLFVGLVAGASRRIMRRSALSSQSQHYELLLQNRELQDARLQIVKQDEIDRRTLAADLHDQVLHDLKSIKQRLSEIRQQPSAQELHELDELVSRAIDGVREVMDNLSPSVLEHIGLPAAIEDCVRRAASKHGFKARFKNNIGEEVLSALTAVECSLLYRIAQEAVNNICKHAEADIVRVNFDVTEDLLRISIVDDGKGIPVNSVNQDSRGLRFMRQRADLMGATIAWLPGIEGEGTRVEIVVDMTGARDDKDSDH